MSENTAGAILRRLSPSVDFSTAPSAHMTAPEWQRLLAVLLAEGATVTASESCREQHGHCAYADHWAVDADGRVLKARHSTNCCTGADNGVDLSGYCPEWAAKMEYAATVRTGPQRDRALAAASRCRAEVAARSHG